MLRESCSIARTTNHFCIVTPPGNVEYSEWNDDDKDKGFDPAIVGALPRFRSGAAKTYNGTHADTDGSRSHAEGTGTRLAATSALTIL
ncbi:hypothetical protein BDD14_2698 [Edaphobacter modestus]|uniref:Uncharacterized protein n=1 Tax=Edaphobacter modestus TaxID=388466 RepID=A0A4V2G4J8_9BACT|nr:hypothetical protein BDD14_2698 [Edaphobacter modestus]